MTVVAAPDGTEIYYKDWGAGPVVVLSHGWPLNADAWDAQMLFLVDHGYRAVAHDRRGHGRSGQSASGNDMDGYADDLSLLIEALDLHDITLVGHSTGGGEVVRYIGRHGTDRVGKVVLVSSITPTHIQTETNPDGVPKKAFDDIRAGIVKDRSQFYEDLATPFYGANMPGANVSQGELSQFWLWSMQSGLKNAYDSITSSSEADFTGDLARIDVPTLVIHGEDDQFVPVNNSAKKTAQLVGGAQVTVYSGAPHGLTTTHQDRFNADLLSFIVG
jgi:non-heme chloroperoxidase